MAAIIPCASPEQAPKKFKTKSVTGRKITLSPERGLEGPAEELIVSPVLRSVQQGGARFARRSGASFRLRVAIGGRGVGKQGAVMCVGRMGGAVWSSAPTRPQAPLVRRVSRRHRRQAPSLVESGGE
ncbi:hypothetical protein NDU88_000609 [Pleurodeles waltl]|uniref:Uncharacterized protein n=1 Tax=Pleurodeles waltl TaxID=8319 RepID=A0AAV7S648_PLEWA|nr:hypothetical protein NDU88_000609 [Pleurodeles waltl]